MNNQNNKLAHNDSPFESSYQSGFPNIENSIENSMHAMQANMAAEEQQMSNAFKHIGEMPSMDESNPNMQE